MKLVPLTTRLLSPSEGLSKRKSTIPCPSGVSSTEFTRVMDSPSYVADSVPERSVRKPTKRIGFEVVEVIWWLKVMEVPGFTLTSYTLSKAIVSAASALGVRVSKRERYSLALVLYRVPPGRPIFWYAPPVIWTKTALPPLSLKTEKYTMPLSSSVYDSGCSRGTVVAGMVTDSPVLVADTSCAGMTTVLTSAVGTANEYTSRMSSGTTGRAPAMRVKKSPPRETTDPSCVRRRGMG